MTTDIRPISPNPAPGAITPVSSLHRISTILKKEFREIFRDKRTVFSVVISPLVITPLLFAFIGGMVNRQVQKMQEQTYVVGVSGGSGAANAIGFLKQGVAHLTFQTVARGQEEAWATTHDYGAVVALPDNADALLAAGNSVPLELLSDGTSEHAGAAASAVRAAFSAQGEKVLAQRLVERNLPAEFTTPFQIRERKVAHKDKTGPSILTMLLPYTLVLAAFGGAIYAAFDQVSGEKERGTLETLLVSPASRRDIVLGKFCAVVGVCLISSLLSIVGLVIAFSTSGKNLGASSGLHLTMAAAGVIALTLLPLSVLFAGLLLAISTFARNQKEAQTYLAPLFTVVLLPAMASMFMDADVALSVALVPILGASIIIKQALSGNYNLPFILLAFAASAVYAGAALAFATKLFQKESVLIKT